MGCARVLVGGVPAESGGHRQVFNVVLPLIRDDLHLSDISVGWIATIFNLFYAVLVPVGGMAGDIFSRKWIVTLSLLFGAWQRC